METVSYDKFDARALQELVLTYHLKDSAIAGIFHVSADAVLKRRAALGLPRGITLGPEVPIEVVYTGRNLQERKSITKEVVSHLYCNELKSDAEIGRILGVDEMTILRKRKKFGIATLSQRDRYAEKQRSVDLRPITDLSGDELAEMYRVHRDLDTIGRVFGVSKMLVTTLMQEKGVDIQAVRDEARNQALNSTQEQLAIGGLLGDGGIEKESFFYYESHSLAQEKYLDWKISVFGGLARPKVYETKTEGVLTPAYQVRFKTISLNAFKRLRESFYVFNEEKGRETKTLPLAYISGLSDLAFSVWYFDDGALFHGYPMIFTGAPGADVRAAVDILNEERDLGIEIQETSRPDGGLEGRKLIFKNLEAFWGIIHRNIPDGFVHKIPVSLRSRERGDYAGSVKKLPEQCKRVASYDASTWGSLEESDRDLWVEDVADYYENVGFPYTSHPDKNEFLSTMRSLHSFQPDKCLRGNVLLQFPSTGSHLAFSYFPNIFSVETNSKDSAYNRYKDSATFRSVIRGMLSRGKAVNDYNMRNALRAFNSVTNFRPSVMKFLCDRYCPEGGHVFDYAAGWSGRLLGACSSDTVARYVCTDVSKQTFYNLRKVAARVREACPDKVVEVHNFPSEDLDGYKDVGSVDFCFSSPPYFNTERYSMDPEQSYRRYPEYGDWTKRYLLATIRNCFNALKEGGVFAINIADVSGLPLEEDAFRYCHGMMQFEALYALHMNTPTGGHKFEPIMVFRKKVGYATSGDAHEMYSSLKSSLATEVSTLIQNEGDALPDEPDLVLLGNKRKISGRTAEVDPTRLSRCLDLIRGMHSRGEDTTRESYAARMPAGSSNEYYPHHVLSRAFAGSWGNVLEAAGVPRNRKQTPPIEHFMEYATRCKEVGRFLTPYAYGNSTGDQSKVVLMKRLGREYPVARALVEAHFLDLDALREHLGRVLDKGH